MTNFETVQKLSETAHVSFTQAKEALEHSNWDLLEAMVYLENKANSQIAQPKSTSSNSQTSGEQAQSDASKSNASFSELLGRFFGFVGKLLNKSMENCFVIEKNDKTIASIPVIIMLFLLLCSAGLVIAILGIGLFFNFRYSFSGPNLGKDSVNNVMNKASNVTDKIKADFKNGMEDARN